MAVKLPKRRSGWLPWRVWWLVVAIITLAVIGTITARHVYFSGLEPVSSSQRTQIFNVEPGSSVKQISERLEKAHLIRSAWSFELYIHSKNLANRLQAGTYALSPSQGTAQVVGIMTRGRVATQ